MAEDEWLRDSLAYVQKVSQLLSIERCGLPAEPGIPPGAETAPAEEGPCDIVLCSPHPDDESLTGSLALRLSEKPERGRVVNLAMTMGSAQQRRQQRQGELQQACRVLGFTNLMGDFDSELLQGASEKDPLWQTMVDGFAQRLSNLAPRMIFFPHGNDAHPTHLAVHRFAREAALLYSRQTCRSLILVETEYWHPMRYPNLLVGVSTEEVARLVCAVSQHRGELARIPYHLLLPARLADNVRRGGELLAGFGEAARPFLFGELYRLSCSMNGKVVPLGKNIVLPPEKEISVDSLAGMFDGCDAGIK